MNYYIDKARLEENEGYIILGCTNLETEEGNTGRGVRLCARTPKGYPSKKVVRLEKAIVTGYEIFRGRMHAKIDEEQGKCLLAEYDESKMKHWFQDSEMPTNTAFGTWCGMHGMDADRIC